MVEGFLTPAWVDVINERLSKVSVDADLFSGDDPVRVVFEMGDGPTDQPHALTFTLAKDGASVAPGDHLAADLLIRLSWSDAELMATGSLDGSQALREGRLKVRGDVNALIPFGSWMVRAHSTIID